MLTRRAILRAGSVGFATALLPMPVWGQAGRGKPNIVWIVGEDMSPDMGCYGDALAKTPNLDKLASQGARFTRCFTHAPVCAPSRSGLITGQYPTTLGSHHMRSKLITAPATFPTFLKQAGYFTAWPGKTDFNFDPPPGWVDSTQDWTRNPAVLKQKQPFFAYANINVTHESQSRAAAEQHAKNTARLKPADRQDPSQLVLPPFYPDTPAVRNDLKQYYEDVTALDYRIGDVLKTLDDQGVADNTIVFFFGDHGRGMPRYKRWCYDTGTRCPLLVRWPGRIQPGSVREDLVAFVDLAPTVLSIAEAVVPAHMQGQAFLTNASAAPGAPRQHCFSARDRMDETFDRIRSVRDVRYRYIRNFNPELPYAQRISYNEQNPTMQAMRKAHELGTLPEAGKGFFARTKPVEELYDCESDPYSITNLAGAPEHQPKLAELRKVLETWIKQTNDLGEVAETELIRWGIVKDVLKDYEQRKVPAQTPAP